MDIKKWFEETSRQRLTDARIAEILDVTRKTANKRINEGLSADDLIAVSRGLGISPIHALVEIGKVSYEEVADFLDGEGQLVESADEGYLALVLAQRLNPISKLAEVNEIAERRSNRPPTPDEDDGTVEDWDDSEEFAADSSPKERGTPDDYLP